MRSPVMAADGSTYEEAWIREWLRECHVSPVTGQPFPHKYLTPNVLLREFILRECLLE